MLADGCDALEVRWRRPVLGNERGLLWGREASPLLGGHGCHFRPRRAVRYVDLIPQE